MTEQNKTSFSELQQLAENGDAQAQYDLAKDLVNRKYYAQPDNTKDTLADELANELPIWFSLSWLEKAAKNGHVDAQFALGLCYFLCSAQMEQINRIKCRWVASNLGSDTPLDPAVKLAFCLVTFAKIIDQDENLAFLWLEKAASQNHVEANFWLGLCYRGGIGVPKDEVMAFRCFTIAAEHDWAEAQYKLAICYLEGKGVAQNSDKGIHWCEVAVENGNAEAMYLLACRYLDNRENANYDLAISLLKKASDKGLDKAKICLLDCVKKGIGIDKIDEVYLHWDLAGHDRAESQYWMAQYYFGGGILNRLDELNQRILDENPKHWRNVYLNKGYEEAFEWAQKAVTNGVDEANLLLGFMSLYGIGTAQNYESAFSYFKQAAAGGKKGIGNYFLAMLCETGQIEGVSDAEVSGYRSNKANPKDIMDFYDIEGLRANLDGRQQDNLISLLVELHMANGDYKAAREAANNNLDLIKYVDRTEELNEKNQELELANKALQEKEHELEETMSMFAHKFRSPLDAIIYNYEHEHQEKLYRQAAQTMRGLLDIFSMISTDSEKLTAKIMQDSRGNGRLSTVTERTLDMILLHLLSAPAAAKIQQHYLHYAKANSLCETELSDKAWREDYFELERQLQAEWEKSYAELIVQSATLEQRLTWLEQRFFKLELRGFDRSDIQFKEYGDTESFLTIVLNEVLVNAFKYYASSTRQPVTLELVARDDFQVLRCQNPSQRNERAKIKGSGKGHIFLSSLARKTASEFSKPKSLDEFILEFGFANELLISH